MQKGKMQRKDTNGHKRKDAIWKDVQSHYSSGKHKLKPQWESTTYQNGSN